MGGQDIFLRLPGTPGGRSYRDLCSMCAQVFCPLPRLLCASASLSFKSAFAKTFELSVRYICPSNFLSRADAVAFSLVGRHLQTRELIAASGELTRRWRTSSSCQTRRTIRSSAARRGQATSHSSSTACSTAASHHWWRRHARPLLVGLTLRIKHRHTTTSRRCPLRQRHPLRCAALRKRRHSLRATTRRSVPAYFLADTWTSARGH